MIFSAIKGQERAARLLEGFLKNRRLPSALLLAGLDGVGKALMARELAKALVCAEPKGMEPCGACPDCLMADKGVHPDIKSVNAAYQASLRQEEAGKQRTLRVETVRHLRRDMEMESMSGGWKTAIMEEAHSLEIEAANALLKILEEPPRKTLWILTTSQKERLPKTVLSRCFCVRLAPLKESVIEKILMERGLDSDRAKSSARSSEGSASRAIELCQAQLPTLEDPLAAFAAAESLPKELYQARTSAELALFALGQNLRLKILSGRAPFSKVENALRRIQTLRSALRSNADPKAVLALACLEAQGCLS
ncbi:MAG: DNA polymerase III subunit [Elusimicrobia bacterium]|nr:DNA polymerase III subunit [Elusimicrobiota bacterium]